MPVLNTSQRNSLENTIIKARKAAENGSRNALMTFAVDQVEPYSHLSPEQRVLRRLLRNRARLLGDTLDGKVQKIEYLTYELAYEYWHKMLFAKFLESNGFLIHPEHGISVSMDDCEELAKEEGHADKWTAAAHYASRMLPVIFRIEDPLMQLDFSTEDRISLENLLAAIDENIFTAEDSLGWVYQFWQSEAKKKVEEEEKGGQKIDGARIPAKTQLFTEPYMVHFLIDNTIGAWWVGHHPNIEPPVKFEYLRFLVDGSPAPGKYEGWTHHTASLTMLDPCMGSGHFVVETFNVLAKLRMHEENLSAVDSAKKTIAENIFGLELDPRCTQIAAFNLALAAWKFMGVYQPLPEMNLACCGVAPRGKKEDWIKLVGKDERMQNGMSSLYDLFQQAPELGSLLDLSTINADLETASLEELQPGLQLALEKEKELNNEEQAERGVMALGINKAAKILSRKFELIVTNVPYLSVSKQSDVLYNYCLTNYPQSRHDLATVFLERCIKLNTNAGCTSVVIPQNWHFLPRYKFLRKKLLENNNWNFTARLGPKAFQTFKWDFNVMLFGITKSRLLSEKSFAGIDVSSVKEISDKKNLLKTVDIYSVNQKNQLKNPEYRIILESRENIGLLKQFADSRYGLRTADSNRFIRNFWEVFLCNNGEWRFHQSTVSKSELYGGREMILHWENGQGALNDYALLGLASLQGSDAWGKKGVAVSLMGELPVTLYEGSFFDNNCAALWPLDEKLLSALWEFCLSESFRSEIRKLDQKLNVTNATLLKIPFDIEYWKNQAAEKYPNGLPEPYSNNPTQWLFNGEIQTSENPLQVAIARLLGYHWPKQTKNPVLEGIEDDDGIVCIPAVNGEPSAPDRLRDLLRIAYGKEWDNYTIEEVLRLAGNQLLNLEYWLRDHFFDQHVKLFQNRPFIWHIWDGRKDGFGVLVNYHKLTKENLRKIIFTYLVDWIHQCEARVRNNESGSEGLLIAAKELKNKLELILEGEPPYDIFIRWKPLYLQPIGWDPDINDGVRLNIRPFMEANILRKKSNIKWDKDRGKNPDTSLYGTVERINDRHFTLAEKREAREKFEEEKKMKN